MENQQQDQTVALGKADREDYSEAENVRSTLMGVIDLIPENKEDSISILNTVRGTLKGAAETLFNFQSALEGKTVTPEKVFRDTLDFTPGSMAAGAATVPKNALGVFSSTISKPSAAEKYMPRFREAISNAEKMEKEGLGAQAIFQDTKLFRDPMKNWSYEISDIGDNVKLDWERINTAYQTGGGMNLTEMLDHPQLYKFTELENTGVKIVGGEGGPLGASYAGQNRVEINVDALRKNMAEGAQDTQGMDLKQAFTNTLFHELQHQQQWSDYVIGGQAKGLGSNTNNAGEVARTLDNLKGLYTGMKMSDFNQSERDLFRLLTPVFKNYHDLAQKLWPNQTKEFYESSRIRDFLFYHSEAGEVEARNVGIRSIYNTSGTSPTFTQDVPQGAAWNWEEYNKIIRKLIEERSPVLNRIQQR